MKMTMRLLVAVIISVVTNANSQANEAQRRNVLFIATDDFRNDLAAYGHPLVKTPNLDRLASRSMRFDRAYCQQALCNPSRASMMLGRRPDSLQIWNLTKHYRDGDAPVVTLPQHFRDNGYFTRGIGKLFHNWKDPAQSDPSSWSVAEQMHIGTHGEDVAIVDGPLPPNLATNRKCECRDVPDESYYDGRIASMAVGALRDVASGDKPFFLGVGFWKPHSPFNAPKKYWDLYQRNQMTMPNPAAWPENAPRIAWHNSRELLGNGGVAIPADEALEIRHGYLANISYLDAQIGRVLDELDRLDLTDNTIVVFLSDHGYHLGEQTLWAKTSNFELDARVPLMIATPDRLTSRSTSALVELLDLFPTLVELCGLPKPRGLDGISLVPVLDESSDHIRPAALTQHPRPAYYQGAPEAMGYSVRTPIIRYAEWRDWESGSAVARELYDHRIDPQETRNVVDDPEYADELQSGIAALESFRPLVHPGWTPVLRPAPTRKSSRPK